MLYPDLRRLSLVCPTGMPGTNQAESSGSNDPPPPPRAGPAQREALGQRDVVATILRNLGGGNYTDACRVAARWCSLNSEHMAVCDDGVWEQLTEAVFPGTRAPDRATTSRSIPRTGSFTSATGTRGSISSSALRSTSESEWRSITESAR